MVGSKSKQKYSFMIRIICGAFALYMTEKTGVAYMRI